MSDTHRNGEISIVFISKVIDETRWGAPIVFITMGFFLFRFLCLRFKPFSSAVLVVSRFLFWPSATMKRLLPRSCLLHLHFKIPFTKSLLRVYHYRTSCLANSLLGYKLVYDLTRQFY